MRDSTHALREKLAVLLLERSFQLGEFTLSSGKKSDYYIDCRTATLHPHGLRLIVSLLLPLVREWKAEQVGGLTLGADPLVAGLSYASAEDESPALLGFIVRKEAKGHGRGRQIEGCLEPGRRTVILEDVITTGESALKAAAAAKEAGANVVGVVAVVDRQEGGTEAIAAAGLPVRVLFTAAELKELARLKKEEKR